MANGQNQIPESAQEALERARRAAGEEGTGQTESEPIDPDTEPIEPGPDGMGDDDPSGVPDGTQMDGMAGPPTQSGTQQAPAPAADEADQTATSEAPAEAQEDIQRAREQAAQGPDAPVETPASQRTATETAPESAQQNIEQAREQAERVAVQEQQEREVVDRDQRDPVPSPDREEDDGPREAMQESVEAFEQETGVDVPGEGPVAQPTGREPTPVDPDERFGAFAATEDFERGITMIGEAFAEVGGDIGEQTGRVLQAGPGVGAGSVRSLEERQAEVRDEPADTDIGRTIERVGRGTGEAPGQLFGEATILSEAPEFAVAAAEDTFAGEGDEFAAEAAQAAINRAVLSAGSAIRNPARTAGNILGGALISGGAAAATGRAATAGSLRAELDPRVGPFGDVTDRARDVRDRFRGDGDGDGDGTTADGDGGPSPVEGPVGEAPGRRGDATAATLGEGDADPTPGVQDQDGGGPDVFGDADGDAPEGGATAGAGPRADVGPDRDAPSQEMGQPGTAGQVVEQRQRPDQMDLGGQRRRTRQRQRQRETEPTVDMDDLGQELERMARERTRGAEPRRVFAPTAEVDIRDPGITRLQRRATRPQARVEGTGPTPVLTDYAATIAGTLGATDAEAVALARSAQEPTVDQPTDTFGGVDTDQPVDIDQPIDVDQPGRVDQPADVDQPIDIDVGPDTDQPGDIDQPTDVDQPVDVDIGQPVDTDRRRDRDIDPDPDPDPDDDDELRLLQEDFLGDDPAPATQFTERQFTVAFADPSDVLGI